MYKPNRRRSTLPDRSSAGKNLAGVPKNNPLLAPINGSLNAEAEALQELGQAEGQVQVQVRSAGQVPGPVREQDYSERQPLLRCSNSYQCFQNCSYWRS